MPRGQRIGEPGDLLRIVGRGHEGRPLVASDDGRRFVVERLARVFRPGDLDLLCWAAFVLRRSSVRGDRPRPNNRSNSATPTAPSHALRSAA